MFSIKNLYHPVNRRISRQILVLGIPVIVSNLSRTVMNMADVAMVGHLGREALAATGMGSMLVWIFLTMAIGLRTATQTVSSRRLGQKKFQQCGTAMHNGHILAVGIMAPITLLGFWFSDRFVPFFINDPVVTPLCISYTSIAFISIFFSSVGFVFQGFFTGVERTRVHMKVSVSANLLNVYLNAGLIYGSSGLHEILSKFNLSWLDWLWGWMEFPAMGVEGAALATLIASGWLMLHYVFYLFGSEFRKKFGVFRFTVDSAMMVRQLQLALPQGIQEVIVTAGYAMFFKIAGLISITALAATEVVFTILQASFMPGIGIGQACATMVGKYLGEGKPDRAEESIVEAVRLSLWFMGSVGLIFLAIPHLILTVFTEDTGVVSHGTMALRLAGLIQFVDAIGLTLWFALSGAGNTTFPAVLETVVVWGFLLPVSYLTGVVLGYGFLGPWVAFGIEVIVFAGVMTWKISQGDWKKIVV
jgi:putative MATE family efflux protein